MLFLSVGSLEQEKKKKEREKKIINESNTMFDTIEAQMK